MALDSNGLALVVSGPSGVGKGTVIRHLREIRPDLRTSVSHTTRPPRDGEVDGQDYIFVSKDEFDRKKLGGEFLEWAVVHRDQSYGTSGKWVKARLDAGEDVVLEIDCQGAFQVRQQIPECIMVFIAPPSWAELVSRLRGRDTESEVEVQKRCESAIPEIRGMCEYEYIVVNDDSEKTARVLAGILHAEHYRVHRQDCESLRDRLLADGEASTRAERS
ncbi:MAG TPA: guanylate kinase [Armatimonadota bacterium]|nr:guanylate kinase [Armatimonadota bacterium]